jgi:hypothetical protein
MDPLLMEVGLKRPVEPPIFCARLMHSSNTGILVMMLEAIANPPAAKSYLTVKHSEQSEGRL